MNGSRLQRRIAGLHGQTVDITYVVAQLRVRWALCLRVVAQKCLELSVLECQRGIGVEIVEVAALFFFFYSVFEVVEVDKFVAYASCQRYFLERISVFGKRAGVQFRDFGKGRWYYRCIVHPIVVVAERVRGFVSELKISASKRKGDDKLFCQQAFFSIGGRMKQAVVCIRAGKVVLGVPGWLLQKYVIL